MLLLLAILVNTSLVVILNYFSKYKIDSLQAIIVNYFVCFLTGSLVEGQIAFQPDTFSLPWFPYAMVISLVFPITFFTVALTVQSFGLTIASIFQKMTMIVPTLVAIILYNEPYSFIKIIGILLAIASIFMINKDKNSQKGSKKWIYPILVFTGSAIIDVGLFYVDYHGIVKNGDSYFAAGLFLMAGIYGSLFLAYDLIKNEKKFQRNSILAGIILGVPNFFSIQLILKSLSTGLGASTVFPIINVGILLTTALVGLIIFSEKFNKFKISGLILAVIAIILISQG